MSKNSRANRKKKLSILDRPYSRILIPQEDGRFHAEILEFPGCFAEGDSPEDAYRNLEAAAEAWVAGCLESGLPVPEPIANYAVSGKFALRLPRSLYVRASKMAAKENVSLNQFVVTAVAEKMGSCSTADILTRHVTRELERLAGSIGLKLNAFAENRSSSKDLLIPEDVPNSSTASAIH